MDQRRQLLGDMAALLSVLSDVHPEPAPSSSLYLGFNCEASRYALACGTLQRAGLVSVTKSHLVSLTPEGVAKAVEVNAVLKQHGVS